MAHDLCLSTLLLGWGFISEGEFIYKVMNDLALIVKPFMGSQSLP